MERIETTDTLAAVVTAHPELARALEHRGLDYCCGGGRTLSTACEERGLDPQAVASELALLTSFGAAPDWASMDALALVDHLVDTHHRYLWDELPRLTALLTKVQSVHGAGHPEIAGIAATFAELRADLEPHLLKEEHVLFPMVRELAAAEMAPSFHCGTLRNPIGVMLREHDAVGDLLLRLRQQTDGYRPPTDGCASYVACFAALEELEADTHLHVHKENNLLFPMVLALEARLAV